MKLSRTDLLPVLTIVAGGVIGASISVSFLGRSPAEDMPAPAPVVASSATAEAIRLDRTARELAPVRSPLEQRRLERIRSGRLATDIEEAQARAEAMAREQRDIVADMDRLVEQRGGPTSEAAGRLFDRKEAMAEEIAELDQEIGRLGGETRTSQREWSDRLEEARRTIEDDKLLERVRYSRGLIGVQDREYTREFEAETTRIIEELLEELRRASDATLDRIIIN